MKAKLDSYIKSENFVWPLFYFEECFCTENADDLEKEYADFICKQLSFGYKSPFENAFMPLACIDGKRTPTYDDLKEEDFAKIDEIIYATSNPFLLAKLNDILFIKRNIDKYGIVAFKNHKILAQHFIDKSEGYLAVQFIERALFLMKSLGDRDSITLFIDHILFEQKYESQHDFAIIINAVFEFSRKTNYNKINKPKIIKRIEECDVHDETDAGLLCIKNVADYYSSANDKTKQNIWINKYSDLCVLLCEKHSPNGYKYIDDAIKMLAKQADQNSQKINDLLFLRDKEQEKMFDSMTFFSIPIDGNIESQFKDLLENVRKKLTNADDSIMQLSVFLYNFSPVREKDLSIYTEQVEKSVFANLTNNILFDSDKKIVEEVEPRDTKKLKEYHTIQAYQFLHKFYASIAYEYLECIKIDDELLKFIEEIVSHNVFVPKERIDIVCSDIIKGLNKNIKQSLLSLISQFEYGCTEFLKSKGIYPSDFKGSKFKPTDLNGYLTEEKYFAPINEILGSDLTNELKYLLVDKRYGNLRNKNYHLGLENNNSITVVDLIAFFRLFNVYCLGYNEEINPEPKHK